MSREERTRAEVLRDAYSEEYLSKRAPVQGYGAGIPWPLHLEAYDAYCKRYSEQYALIDLVGRGCRGGFGTGELDMFIPGWRDRVSEMTRLQEQVSALQTKLNAVPTTGSGSGDFSIGGDLWPGLSKLIEECGEVIQVAGKLMGSEGRTDHWSGDLNQMLIEELGDLRAAISFFIEANNIGTDAVSARHAEKLSRFWQWHRDTQAKRHA